MRASDQAQGFFLVLFENGRVKRRSQSPPPASRSAISRDADDEIQVPERAAQRHGRAIRSGERRAESPNEELQAMNEEMRSAAEELETSKEELQSVNEELTTVNHELKSSVEELSRTNADLNNLMASTDIGTIFFDRQLRIHRFTPSAQKIFNLIPAGHGPPASPTSRAGSTTQVSSRDAENVLRGLADDRARSAGRRTSTWYLTRIAPYRTARRSHRRRGRDVHRYHAAQEGRRRSAPKRSAVAECDRDRNRSAFFSSRAMAASRKRTRRS